MKKIFLYLIITGFVLMMLTGCPAVLQSKLPSDIVITLGRFNPTANNTLYGPVGGTLSVPVTISDQTGRALTGTYTVVFTLSVDADLSTTADNTVLSTDTAVTAGSEQIIDITVPGTVAAAIYTLFAAVSEAGDTVINNNTASVLADIGALTQPNLVITSLETGNDMGGYLPGADGTLIYKIQNTGYAAIGTGTSFLIRFAVDLVILDTEVGTHTITLEAPLYPQGFITGTAAFTMPSAALLAADKIPPEIETTFTTWSETLTATVDSGGVIAESNEGDNVDTSLWISSGSEKPELSVTSVNIAAATEYAKAGNDLEYSVKITNSGFAAASGYAVELFVDIDGDGTNNAGDISLYTWATPPTVPYDLTGTQNTIILNVPAGEVYPVIADGVYYVRAVITGLTEEWDDTNNTSGNGQSEWVTFVTTAFDLEMYSMFTSLTTAVDEAAGGPVPITYTIYNSGEDDVTTDFNVHFYANATGAFPAGDIDLGTDTVTDTISGNGRTAVSHVLTFPAGQGADFYTIYWILDEADTVAELDEGNNFVTNAEECFVFFPVTDGSTGINVNCIAYNPPGGKSGRNGLRAIFYWNDWGSRTSCNRGSYKDPGERFFYFSRTLTPGEQYGLAFKERGCFRTGTGLPYTFRFVPSYVYYVPELALPYALGAEDVFENNDSTSAAALLSGSDNPLTGFVNAFAFTEDYSTYDEDFYLFDIP